MTEGMVREMAKMNFERQRLPVGDDEFPLLIAREDQEPRAVFMSYESFLDLAATLYTAIEALRVAGVDPSVLSDEDLGDDLAEFRSWDEDFEATDIGEDEDDQTPHLRLVVGG